MDEKKLIRPGRFGIESAADGRRVEFDFKNEVIVTNNVKIDTVFFGDSITHFWELGAYFKSENGIIVNRGIGGDHTEYAIRRMEADVLQLKPEKCVMLIGVNDAWDMEYDNWYQLDGMEYDYVVDRAYKNLTEMLEMGRKAGIRMYFCSILPTCMNFTNREELRHRYIKEINEKMKVYCEQEKIPYVDYYSRMVEEDGITLQRSLTFEGIHPNVHGYDIMADALKKVMTENGDQI